MLNLINLSLKGRRQFHPQTLYNKVDINKRILYSVKNNRYISYYNIGPSCRTAPCYCAVAYMFGCHASNNDTRLATGIPVFG